MDVRCGMASWGTRVRMHAFWMAVVMWYIPCLCEEGCLMLWCGVSVLRGQARATDWMNARWAQEASLAWKTTKGKKKGQLN
jgi:hypothetical protein